MSGNRICYELWSPDTKLASFPEIGAPFDRGKKLIGSINEIRGQSHTGCVSHDVSAGHNMTTGRYPSIAIDTRVHCSANGCACQHQGLS